MAGPGKPSQYLLRFTRRTNAAWRDIGHAKKAISKQQADDPSASNERILRHLGEAETALRRAYSAFAPRARRMPRVAREERKEPLWRCRYCQVLVWQGERTEHLKVAELGRSLHGPAAKLELHFTRVEPAEDDDEDEEGEEDEDDAHPY